jgi:hypothetical protein
MIRADEPMESVEDPMGLQRPADQDDDASAADLADSLAELPEVRMVRTPGTPREVLESDAPHWGKRRPWVMTSGAAWPLSSPMGTPAREWRSATPARC